jgi:hypothetical protein
MGQLIWGALKAIGGAIATAFEVVVGGLFALFGLGADAIWWALHVSWFAKKILPIPDHPPLSDGVAPITTWVIRKTVDAIKGTWDYLFGEPTPNGQ